MSKLIRFVIAILICFFIDSFIFSIPKISLLAYASTIEKDQKIDISKQDEKNLDQIFGPDLNFPFRPENHRDNSSPVKRINPIVSE
tara:strand:+ start:348 stop:605 length:258 start_codon:yes stop_codon:yes gene_type:complete